MPELPMVGTDFAGYWLRSVLGRGGMSIVYQAENPRLRSLIALKVLAPHLAHDDVFRSRFREESQIAASLNHPNVIPIHDFGSHGGLLYIAMRYVPGTDLGQLIAERGWLEPQAAVSLLEQAARALDAAHSRGLVHRDVKPGNLLIASGADAADPDHVYLADFGITKYTGASTGLTLAGTVLGTAHYVSPEQIREQPVYGTADQYSLGCVLYECLTGRAPFERDTHEAVLWAHVNERAVPPSALRPGLPPVVDEVFARVLAKDPEDRYPSCRAFIADAREAIAPTGASRPARVAADSLRAAVRLGDRVTPTTADAFRDVPDFRGQVTFDNDRPARRRRVRRARRGGPRRDGARPAVAAAAVGAAVAVIAAGATTAGLALSKASDVARSGAAGSAASSGSARASVLYTALSGAAITGRLQLSTCRQRGAADVVCTGPDSAISSVSFTQYPSVSSLYAHYQEIIEKLTGEKFSEVQNMGAVCNGVNAPDPTGENTWNHTNIFTHSYTISQMSAGKVANASAMGRVFCQQTNSGSEVIVWTEDFGRMLGYATGAQSHEQVWNWFVPIHHSIIFPGMAPMTSMSTAGQG